MGLRGVPGSTQVGGGVDAPDDPPESLPPIRAEVFAEAAIDSRPVVPRTPPPPVGPTPPPPTSATKAVDGLGKASARTKETPQALSHPELMRLRAHLRRLGVTDDARTAQWLMSGPNQLALLASPTFAAFRELARALPHVDAYGTPELVSLLGVLTQQRDPSPESIDLQALAEAIARGGKVLASLSQRGVPPTTPDQLERALQLEWREGGDPELSHRFAAYLKTHYPPKELASQAGDLHSDWSRFIQGATRLASADGLAALLPGMSPEEADARARRLGSNLGELVDASDTPLAQRAAALTRVDEIVALRDKVLADFPAWAGEPPRLRWIRLAYLLQIVDAPASARVALTRLNDIMRQHGGASPHLEVGNAVEWLALAEQLNRVRPPLRLPSILPNLEAEVLARAAERFASGVGVAALQEARRIWPDERELDVTTFIRALGLGQGGMVTPLADAKTAAAVAELVRAYRFAPPWARYEDMRSDPDGRAMREVAQAAGLLLEPRVRALLVRDGASWRVSELAQVLPAVQSTHFIEAATIARSVLGNSPLSLASVLLDPEGLVRTPARMRQDLERGRQFLAAVGRSDGDESALFMAPFVRDPVNEHAHLSRKLFALNHPPEPSTFLIARHLMDLPGAAAAISSPELTRLTLELAPRLTKRPEPHDLPSMVTLLEWKRQGWTLDHPRVAAGAELLLRRWHVINFSPQELDSLIQLSQTTDWKQIDALADDLERRGIRPMLGDLSLLALVTKRPDLRRLLEHPDHLRRQLSTLYERPAAVRSYEGEKRHYGLPGAHPERPPLERLPVMMLLRLHVLNEAMHDKTFLEATARAVASDIADTSTEWGGELVARTDGGLIPVMYRSVLYNYYSRSQDGAYWNPHSNSRVSHGLFHLHFHALTADETRFSGPSAPDVDSIGPRGRAGVVLTTLGHPDGAGGKPNKLRVNFDAYETVGSGKTAVPVVFDLGEKVVP